MGKKAFNKLKEIKESLFPLPAIIATIVIFLDQWTKYLTVKANHIHPSLIHTVHDQLFNIVHYRNKGAAWGIFDEYTNMLAIISLLASIYLIFNFKLLVEGSFFRSISLALILGGIIGNWIDRQFYPEGVIDMIEVFIPLPKFLANSSYQFPAFNIADSSITIGISLLILRFLWLKFRK